MVSGLDDLGINPGIEVLENITNYLNSGKKEKLKINNYIAEGFCLYSAIIALELKAEDFAFYNEPNYVVTKVSEDILNNLANTKSGRGKTREELVEKMKENNLVDIRNAFEHGNFLVAEQDGFKLFVLNPNRPKNISQYPMMIFYEDIYKVVGKKYREFFISNKEDLNKLQILYKHYALSFVEMARYCGEKDYKNIQTASMIKNGQKFIEQFFLTVLSVVYNQTKMKDILSEHPEKWEKLCIFRNSTAHSNTKFEEGNFKFIDDYKGIVKEKDIPYEKLSVELLDIEVHNLQQNLAELERIVQTRKADGRATGEELEELEQSCEKLKEGISKLKEIVEYKLNTVFKLIPYLRGSSGENSTGDEDENGDDSGNEDGGDDDFTQKER